MTLTRGESTLFGTAMRSVKVKPMIAAKATSGPQRMVQYDQIGGATKLIVAREMLGS